jgi:hypothetical protein
LERAYLLATKLRLVVSVHEVQLRQFAQRSFFYLVTKLGGMVSVGVRKLTPTYASLKDYKIWLSFNDGAEGEINLLSELYGEIFEPLKNISLFQSFTL